jgi:succinate dehydrogenase / fumarate reductase cytochrome b subunit
MSTQTQLLPTSFILRRLHSLTGLWIVLFLFEHLLTNSQAALFLGDDGAGFIHAVNFIKRLPYLQVIEVFLIGAPIVFHGILGIRYAITGKSNYSSSNGSKPSLDYGRNRAYSLQRISSWILLIGIIAHVGYMRFYIYPVDAKEGMKKQYFVRLNMDLGLYTVADRLNVKLYDQATVDQQVKLLDTMKQKMQLVEQKISEIANDPGVHELYEQEAAGAYNSIQRYKEKKEWVEALQKRTLSPHQVIGVSNDFGSVTLLNVREAFKSPIKCALYTLFVLAACFHAFNGLWTFMLSWGMMIKVISQKKLLKVCMALMALVTFLGLSSIWGTYFLNLKN